MTTQPWRLQLFKHSQLKTVLGFSDACGWAYGERKKKERGEPKDSREESAMLSEKKQQKKKNKKQEESQREEFDKDTRE